MNYKIFFKNTIKDIFYTSLISFAVFFVVEMIDRGLVSNYLNLNWVLLLVLLSGVVFITIKKRPTIACF